MWATLETELDADLGVRRLGGLMVAETEADLALLERKSRLERPFGIDTEIVTTRDMLAIAPHLLSRLRGAAFCPEEGSRTRSWRRPRTYGRPRVTGGASPARARDRDRADGGALRVQTVAGAVEAGRRRVRGRRPDPRDRLDGRAHPAHTCTRSRSWSRSRGRLPSPTSSSTRAGSCRFARRPTARS